MTDDELRDGANGLMNHAESPESRANGTVVIGRLFAHRLGSAVLKLLPPADDGEAVADESDPTGNQWLDSIRAGDVIEWEYEVDTEIVILSVSLRGYWVKFPLPDGTTRGSVRRLLVALGVTMKEPAAGGK